jgi:hypothetical protein
VVEIFSSIEFFEFWRKFINWLVKPISSHEVKRDGGRLSIVWLNLLPRWRISSEGGRLLIGWLNIFPVLRCETGWL